MSTALIMMTDPGNPEANGRMVHMLKTAQELSERGDEVAIYLHGAGVNWAAAFASRDDRFTQNYGVLFDEVKPLIAGACNFCANVRFGQGDALRELGIGFVGVDGAHHTAADIIRSDTSLLTF